MNNNTINASLKKIMHTSLKQASFKEYTIKNLEIIEMPSGYSGRKLYKITCLHKPYLFKYYPDHKNEKIKKDIAILKKTTDLGLSPRLYNAQKVFDHEPRLLCMEYIEGKKLSINETKDYINPLLNKLKFLHSHSIDEDLKAYSIFDQIKDFYVPVKDLIAHKKTDEKIILDIKKTINKQSITPVFVHNDLHIGNIIVNKNNDIHFIDWEYAGLLDPLEDVAILSINLALNNNEAKKLIKAYYAPKKILKKDMARYLLLRYVVLYRIGLYHLAKQKTALTNNENKALCFNEIAFYIHKNTLDLKSKHGIDKLILCAITQLQKNKKHIYELISCIESLEANTTL